MAGKKCEQQDTICFEDQSVGKKSFKVTNVWTNFKKVSYFSDQISSILS